jgi:hypothetical protein
MIFFLFNIIMYQILSYLLIIEKTYYENFIRGELIFIQLKKKSVT